MLPHLRDAQKRVPLHENSVLRSTGAEWPRFVDIMRG